MKKKFRKHMVSLADVFDFMKEFMVLNGIDDSSAYAINLAVEEIFTNFVKYGTKSDSEISVDLLKEADKLTVQIVDLDAEEFDVTAFPKADTDLPLKDRKIGGLGIHLVRQMMDEVKYEYKDQNSKITLVKYLGR
ncbi:MAG: ATP-binding protein [Candidatus Zixiibacteriota bacterium]|nr:MAG: ATP-binding protein [candidate division Zixibacteria bacterium]